MDKIDIVCIIGIYISTIIGLWCFYELTRHIEYCDQLEPKTIICRER